MTAWVVATGLAVATGAALMLHGGYRAEPLFMVSSAVALLIVDALPPRAPPV